MKDCSPDAPEAAKLTMRIPVAKSGKYLVQAFGGRAFGVSTDGKNFHMINIRGEIAPELEAHDGFLTFQYPVLNGYKDDLRQEILIRLNNELPVFDPEKSSFNTFFRRVLHAAMYDARKVYFRNQNLTLRFAAELEDFESDDTDSIPAESLAAYARYSKNTVEEEMLKQDVHTIIQTCSPELQKVTNALLAGCSIRFLARQHQMTVPRFRRMYIRPLRKAFEKNF